MAPIGSMDASGQDRSQFTHQPHQVRVIQLVI
jgi:hypothetical protein